MTFLKYKWQGRNWIRWNLRGNLMSRPYRCRGLGTRLISRRIYSCNLKHLSTVCLVKPQWLRVGRSFLWAYGLPLNLLKFRVFWVPWVHVKIALFFANCEGKKLYPATPLLVQLMKMWSYWWMEVDPSIRSDLVHANKNHLGPWEHYTLLIICFSKMIGWSTCAD